MSLELKIKSKHLSLEAKVIRFEEKKLLKKQRSNALYYLKLGNSQESSTKLDTSALTQYYSLYKHRTRDVRHENRATYLARAYLSGVSYNTIEVSRKEHKESEFCCYVVPRVIAMVVKYGKSVPNPKYRPNGYSKPAEDNPEYLVFIKSITDWLQA